MTTTTTAEEQADDDEMRFPPSLSLVARLPSPPPSPRPNTTAWRRLCRYKGFDLRTWEFSDFDNPVAGENKPTDPAISTPIPAPLAKDPMQSPGPPPPTQPPRLALTEFHLFPQLPIEIRLQIWRLYLQRPRIVVVRSFLRNVGLRSSAVESPGDSAFRISNVTWYTENRTPVLMRVCRESRDEALSFYRIHLPAGDIPDTITIQGKRNPAVDRIPINPEWDLVLYTASSMIVSFAVLLSDLMAYDPLHRGMQHVACTEWPLSIFQLNPQPGASLLPLHDSVPELRTWVVFEGAFDSGPAHLGEGHVFAVRQDVVSGRLGKLAVNAVARATLGSKNLRRGTLDNLVVVRAKLRDPLGFNQPPTYDSSVPMMAVIEMIWDTPVRLATERSSRMSLLGDDTKTTMWLLSVTNTDGQ